MRLQYLKMLCQLTFKNPSATKQDCLIMSVERVVSKSESIFKRNANAFSLNAIVNVHLRRRRRHEMVGASCST